MSTHSKGYRRERQCREELEKDGYLTDIKNWSKFSTKDFYNMFDVVAVKGDEVLWVQVKSNKSGFYSARKEIQLWLEENNLAIRCQVWLKENNKPWRISDVTSTGYS